MKPPNVLALLALFAFLHSPSPTMSADINYSSAINALEGAVQNELKDFGIGGIAVALTDGQRLVHAAGYGQASRDSVFRAGSISKLFNAVAVMQQVEAGKLSLDAPFGSLPGAVEPANPYPDSPGFTLRHLLCHRSGIQREAPVGGYLDLTQPTLAATCDSVRGCVLVTPPNAKTRYSNIGPSLAGRVVESVTGSTFQEYQRRRLFAALGMTHSAWRLQDLSGVAVIPSGLRVADGKGGFSHQRTPVFDLGTIPAGNLYTTAPDLAQFIFMLDAKGAGQRGSVLSEASLAEMTRPQLDPEGAFGLGFALGKFRSHKTIGHNGAVYGHSTALLYLPDARIGVVVLANEDIVGARVGRLANTALALLLETQGGERPASPAADVDIPREAPTEFAGAYESQSFWAEFHVRQGKLEGNYASQPCVLARVGKDAFRLNSRIHDDVAMTFVRGESGAITGCTVGIQKFKRVPESRDGIPEAWKPLRGSYGPKVIPIVVHEKFGHLYVTTENMVDYRLRPVNRNVFLMPPGMYEDEQIVFLTDGRGRVPSVNFANMILPRLR
ncbi:MAG: beta-lactamase family protein [Verrucomicrobia bacterium]|nr:beta-lactamase family protein [Verrucomicrobiota bacterium]